MQIRVTCIDKNHEFQVEKQNVMIEISKYVLSSLDSGDKRKAEYFVNLLFETLTLKSYIIVIKKK